MEPWGTPHPGVPRRHPGLKILMYKDVSATRRPAARDRALPPTGVSYADADRHHPVVPHRRRRGRGWVVGLCRPVPHGRRQPAAYQDAWAGGVLGELRAHDWDGVVLDDTLTYLSHPTVDELVSTQIPDDAAQYAATQSFLPRRAAAEGGRLPRDLQRHRRVGHLGHHAPAWSRYVSGWEDEYFVKWGLDTGTRFTGADWEWKMQLAAWCADRRLPLVAVTYSSVTDRDAQTYHRATWLLTWNGATGASVFVPAGSAPATGKPRRHRPRATVRRSGPPADGVYRRAYTRGLVVVNPMGARGSSTSAAPTSASGAARSPRSACLPPARRCCAGEPHGRTPTAGIPAPVVRTRHGAGSTPLPPSTDEVRSGRRLLAAVAVAALALLRCGSAQGQGQHAATATRPTRDTSGSTTTGTPRPHLRRYQLRDLTVGHHHLRSIPIVMQQVVLGDLSTRVLQQGYWKFDAQLEGSWRRGGRRAVAHFTLATEQRFAVGRYRGTTGAPRTAPLRLQGRPGP